MLFRSVDVFGSDRAGEEPELQGSGVSRGLSLKGHDTHFTARIFPHICNAEGHFCAVLRKDGNETGGKEVKTNPKIDKNLIEAFGTFARSVLHDERSDVIRSYFKEHLKIYNGHVYTFNTSLELPDKIDFAKKGFYIGRIRSGLKGLIFEPSHQLLTSLRHRDIINTVSLGSASVELSKYLKGETIFLSEDIVASLKVPCYIAVEADGFPVGWGKLSSDGTVKNMYPKGWRKQ